MFALHWICALTLALVSCLGAQPVRNRAELLGYISDLRNTTEQLNCSGEIRLYSPVGVTPDCMSSALNCVIDDLKTLQYECDFSDDTEDIDNVVTALRSRQNTPTNSARDCICETYDKRNVTQFLDNMERLVQQLNSMQ